MTLDKTWFNALVNDDGSNALGTVWNKERIAELLASIDAIQQQCCLLSTSVNLSWGTGVWAKVGFGTEHFDPKNMHAANDTEIWLPAGTYQIDAQCTWPESTAGMRGMHLAFNDVNVMSPPGYQFIQPFTSGLGIGVNHRLTTLYLAPVPQRMSVHLYQNSGIAQVIPATGVSVGVFRIS